MRLHDLAAGRGELRLILRKAGPHLRRLADELRAKALSVGAAGHLLLHRRAVLCGRLRDAGADEGKSESGGFQRGRLGHGSTFSIGLGLKFESAENLVQIRFGVDPMFMAVSLTY